MNVFEYAAHEESFFEVNLKQFGYKRITTFYSDLSIAEWYGSKSIKETYEMVCKEWIGDYKYFTEFIMCLNYKSWEHYDNKKSELSSLYSDLYYKAIDLFYEHYDGDDPECEEARDYFFKITN